MSKINPYESPRGLESSDHWQEPVTDARPVLAYVSIITFPIAGILGAALFLAIMQALVPLPGAFQVALSISIAAVFGVLIVADGYLQGARPAFFSAIIGMLLASPFAYGSAFLIGLQAYDMSSRRDPGAGVVALLCYFSFFLTLSLGGWLAVCRTRNIALSERELDLNRFR